MVETSTSGKRQSNSKKVSIKLTTSEIEKISLLYEIALNLSLKESNTSSTTMKPNGSEDLVEKKRKAWHDVQDYFDELGKKYDYDPEKYVINKITRELEIYQPDL